MMKYLKLLLSTLMLCCALTVLAPAMDASAAQAEIDSGKCGKNLTWTLTEDGTLTISGKGEMKDYGFYTDVPWYQHRASISTLVIEDGVTSITSYAFWDHDGLTALSFPDSMVSIGQHAFSDCNHITGTVTFPASVTTIGDYAFSDCNRITGIAIYGDAEVGVRAFDFCDSLTELFIGSGVTTLATKIYNNDSGLETITVSEENEYFCSIDGVLYDKALTRLIRCPRKYTRAACTIPDGIKTIGAHAFEDCDVLSTITIPGSVTTIEYSAFYSPLGSYLIYYLGTEEEWNAIQVGTMNNALERSTIIFSDDAEESLLTGICGDDLTWTLAPDGTFTIAGTGDMYDYEGVSETEWFTFRSSIVHVVAEYGVTSIGAAAFDWCENLKSVTLSETVAAINRLAFMDCFNLESVTLSDGITSIGSYAFSSCRNLTSINLPDGITSIGDSAFRDCASLTEITIPDSVTQLGDFAFDGCADLTSVVVPSSIGTVSRYAFAFCSSLEKVTIDDGITCIDEFAFYDCPSLKEITIPDSVGSIGIHAFNGSDKLATVVYRGTQEQWEQIEIDGYNEDLLAATILATPALTAANNASTGKITVKWSAVEDAEKYELWRAASKNGKYTRVWTGTGTSVTHNSAKPGETYYYKVRAVADGVSGTFSAAVGRTCDLARPVVTVKNNANTGKIVVSWEKISGAVKYELWRCATKDGTYKKVWTGTGTSVAHNSAKPGETYYYKVRAIHEASSANSALSAAKGRTCDLARPVVKITLNSKGKPVVSWGAVDGAVKYELWRSTSPDGGFVKVWTGTKTRLTHNTAEKGVTYYYKVRAICSNASGNSAYSSVKSVTMK